VLIDPCRGDVGVAEPLLHLGDVGLMVEGIGGGRRAERVGADLEADLPRIGLHEHINAIGRERFVEPAGAVVRSPQDPAGGTVPRLRLITETVYPSPL
jgi:hypothetical protein